METQILKNAGIPMEDCMELERVLNRRQKILDRPCHDLPHVVCTGIYNAGKSTLLNALTGTNHFPTGDVPTTKEIAQMQWGQLVYVDTPGLNADSTDDAATRRAFREADVILFAASTQNGGVGQSESQWLLALQKQFGARFQERLIFVLTKCSQVEEDALGKITDKFSKDLKSVLGFAPETLFCTDAVTWQDGKEQSQPLLMDVGGVDSLREHIEQKCAAMQRSMEEDAQEDLEQAQKDINGIIGRMKEQCQKKLREISTEEEKKEIDKLFTDAKKSIHKAVEQSAYVNSYFFCPREYKNFEGKSEFGVMSDAKKALKSYARKCLSEISSTARQSERQAIRYYCTVGNDSVYLKVSNSVNQALENLCSLLRQRGIAVNELEEIDVMPDQTELSELSSDISSYVNGGVYWSEDRYVSVFYNRMEVHKSEYGYEEKALFGRTKWIPKYYIDGFGRDGFSGAADEISDEIKSEFKNQCELAESSIAGVLDSFLKEVKNKSNRQLAAMRKEVDKYLKATAQETAKPFQEALDYLDRLGKEVSQ